MDLRYIRTVIDHLDNQGILFERGLGDDEVARVEAAYGFRFPPDLRKLLQYALPTGARFPNWRKGPAASLREGLAWPVEGILRDVERHGFWPEDWPDRPGDQAEALAVARAHLRAAPILIPVHAHRYLPAEPHQVGNPIFSVVGTDIIYAGCDLASYFAAEFGIPCPSWAATTPRPIALWSDLVA